MKQAYNIFTTQRSYIDELDSIDPELIPQMFGILDRVEQEQLMALVAIIKTDLWMDNPIIFEDLVLILNGILPSMLEFEGCSIPHIWYALYILKKLRPDLELGELVKGYIDWIHSEAGFFIYPKEANMKSPIVSELPNILEKINNTEFKDFDFDDHQASMITESIEYIDAKLKEDGIK